MKTEQTPENPSFEEAKKLLQGFRILAKILRFFEFLGITNEQSKKLREEIENIGAQSDVIYLPSQFNDAFQTKGWITVGQLNAETMKEALQLHDEGKDDLAEELLVDWFTKENIALFILGPMRRIDKTMKRKEQLQEAFELYLEERYWAAIPLILIVCDGFVSDITGSSPFEKDADLRCFDSLTGHSTALPALIKLLTKGVRKSYDDEIDLPLRHGILHGRSLGYANKTICAKAWLLMMAFVDWANDKASEEWRKKEYIKEKSITFADCFKTLKDSQASRLAMDAFEPYEVVLPFGEPLDPTGPEFATMEFLSGWKARNYGKMGKYAMNQRKCTDSQMAGEIRNLAKHIELIEYEIRLFRYSTIARCDVQISARAKIGGSEVTGIVDLFLLKFTQPDELAIQNEDEFRWAVQQNFICSMLNKKFAKDS